MRDVGFVWEDRSVGTSTMPHLLSTVLPRKETIKLRITIIIGIMAGRPGFEPGLLGPEPRVLPLNYLPFQYDTVFYQEKFMGSSHPPMMICFNSLLYIL